MASNSPTFGDLELRLLRADALPPGVERQVVDLFTANYLDADVDYLRQSMRQLRWLGVALEGTRLVGFGLAESRRIDLPRLPRQVVRLAGLACVAPEHRRRGLMSQLSGMAVAEGFAAEPALVCGRMAHPASFRGMSRLLGCLPRLGTSPSPWQREVAEAIAAAYRVESFDAATFVCRGRGRPVGRPRLEIEATEAEWEVFRPVDRERGDSLLGMAWLNDPPLGWS